MNKIALTLTAFASLCGAILYYSHVNNSILIQNIEALSRSENPNSESDCRSNAGNWNMASVCVSGGFEEVTCEVEGEITFLGVTLKGHYESGRGYVIPWALYSCQNSPSNCCTKQGLYSGDQHLA